MREPATRERLRARFERADEGQRRAMVDALAIAGQRAAAAYLVRLRRQHVAVDLLVAGATAIDAEGVLIQRFGTSRVTAWRDVCAAQEAISRIAPR